MNTILLIEDEENVADFIIKGLKEEGYRVIHASDGLAGIELLNKNEIQLVLLDILLPKMNGLEVCKTIRESGYEKLPVIMLTALNSAENVVLGLDSGADDYLAKPFKLIELKARIRTLLRRIDPQNALKKTGNQLYRFADVELDDSSKSVTRAGQEVLLTSTEFRLLLTFLKNKEIVLSRTTLLDEVWGINFDIGTNVVDVYVNYLRKKLDQFGSGKLIHTVIGMGYVLREER